MLTKSLHTVTAVTNVAALILSNAPTAKYLYNVRELTGEALIALGYRDQFLESATALDPTVEKCVAAVHKMVHSAWAEELAVRADARAAAAKVA